MSENEEIAARLNQWGHVLFPQEAAEPILAAPVRKALLEWLEEIWAGDALRAVGLEPRCKALFSGVPGTGKTTLAHHLAARLGLPMLVVRPEKVQSRYVGASAEQVGRLFDAVHREADPIFLFFDEFDSLGAQRMGSGLNEVGEQDHNHKVNTLLANMERYDGFIVAATNFGSRIDEAIWRRFEIQIRLDEPGPGERRRILARYFAPFVLPREALEKLSEAMATATPALMRRFCEHIKRQIVVGPRADWSMDRDSVISRVLTTVEPHPDAGKPRLWSHGVDDKGLRAFPWPLKRDLKDYPETQEPAGVAVSHLRVVGGEGDDNATA